MPRTASFILKYKDKQFSHILQYYRIKGSFAPFQKGKGIKWRKKKTRKKQTDTPKKISCTLRMTRFVRVDSEVRRRVKKRQRMMGRANQGRQTRTTETTVGNSVLQPTTVQLQVVLSPKS